MKITTHGFRQEDPQYESRWSPTYLAHMCGYLASMNKNRKSIETTIFLLASCVDEIEYEKYETWVLFPAHKIEARVRSFPKL